MNQFLLQYGIFLTNIMNNRNIRSTFLFIIELNEVITVKTRIKSSNFGHFVTYINLFFNLGVLCNIFYKHTEFGLFLWFGFYSQSRLFHSIRINRKMRRKPATSRTWLVSRVTLARLESTVVRSEEWFRVLKISILNHSAMGTAFNIQISLTGGYQN